MKPRITLLHSLYCYHIVGDATDLEVAVTFCIHSAGCVTRCYFRPKYLQTQRITNAMQPCYIALLRLCLAVPVIINHFNGLCCSIQMQSFTGIPETSTSGR